MVAQQKYIYLNVVSRESLCIFHQLFSGSDKASGLGGRKIGNSDAGIYNIKDGKKSRQNVFSNMHYEYAEGEKMQIVEEFHLNTTFIR